MRISSIIGGAVFMAAWALTGAPLAAAPRVELELATESNFPATAQQQWYSLLTELKVDSLRIRKAGAEDKAAVETGGTKQSPVYRVVGFLTSDNQLVVPGGRFSARDRSGISAWLKKLREEGPERVQSKGKLPFGLLPDELAEVNADLSRRVTFSTKDKPLAEAVSQIAGKLKFPLDTDRRASLALREAERIRDELEGVSSGTALAYLLRPAGLALEPVLDSNKKLRYLIGLPSAGRTAWPVGWTPDQPARELLPQLFEQLNVDLDDALLADTLSAISERLGAPVLYDHYALTRHGVDLEKATVKLPPKRLAYAVILNKVLHQANLKGEWRVDENDKPLLWVTTLKPVK